MKVFCLVGKSGTGKSFQAVNLCRKMNIESIIDDGLFICNNRVEAGISAKRQPTKFGAVKTALFFKDEHAEETIEAIERLNPESILVLGTSDAMVDKIIARLGLEAPEERIYIEDITTEEDRAMAYKQRNEFGKHVIPAPSFQLKKQFSGYFLSPQKIFRGLGRDKDPAEKSVVRPSYSYLGGYHISEKVMSDIIECVKEESESVYEICRVIVDKNTLRGEEGLEISIVANLNFAENLPNVARLFQERVAHQIEMMTAFNVNKVDLEIRDVI